MLDLGMVIYQRGKVSTYRQMVACMKVTGAEVKRQAMVGFPSHPVQPMRVIFWVVTYMVLEHIQE